MCLMLYIGTAAPLPLVTSADLRVEAVAPDRTDVRQWFTHPQVHFVGAHTGCSCGFPSVIAETPVEYYDGMPLDSDDRAADLRSVEALLDLLRQALRDSGLVELYPIADGDEAKEPKGQLEWIHSELVAERLFFNEGFVHRVHGNAGGSEGDVDRPTRRALLLGLAAAMMSQRHVFAQPSSFAGRQAGETREVNGVPLCWCPPGHFVMGSPRNEPERRSGEDQAQVTLSRGFWMARFETTQGQWTRVMGALPGPLTAGLPAGDDLPVGNVNFAEAEAYCRTLTTRGRAAAALPANWEFRLPTEAQWEYACRAGTTTATAFGNTLSSSQANFKGKPYNGAASGPSLNRAARVGSYSPNAWGLHDMHGNTFEWCRDWYHLRLPGGTDPDLYLAQDSATRSEHGVISRVRRGGCWADDGWPCRSAFRLRFEPDRRYDHIGFRVVAVPVA
jgi:sulfatase modifying factor 1